MNGKVKVQSWLATIVVGFAFQVSLAVYPEQLKKFAWLMPYVWVVAATIGITFIIQWFYDLFSADKPRLVDSAPFPQTISPVDTTGSPARRNDLTKGTPTTRAHNVNFVSITTSRGNYTTFCLEEEANGTIPMLVARFRNDPADTGVHIPKRVCANVRYFDFDGSEVLSKHTVAWLDNKGVDIDFTLTKVCTVALLAYTDTWSVPTVKMRNGMGGQYPEIEFSPVPNDIAFAEIVLYSGELTVITRRVFFTLAPDDSPVVKIIETNSAKSAMHKQQGT